MDQERLHRRSVQSLAVVIDRKSLFSYTLCHSSCTIARDKKA